MCSQKQQIVEIIDLTNGDIELPKYEQDCSAGMDIRTNIHTPVILGPNGTKLFSTGIKLRVPDGYEIQIRTRAKTGLPIPNEVVVKNSMWIIDSLFKEEIGIILTNTSSVNSYVVNPGDYIAQLVLSPILKIKWELING